MKEVLGFAAACLMTLWCTGCNQTGNNSVSPPATGKPAGSIQQLQARTDQQPVRPESSPPRRDQVDYGSPLTGVVSDLEGLISDLGGRVTDREIIIDLPADVFFDFDQADIRSGAVETLEKLTRLIKQAGDGVIQVNGHTDAIGNDAYNITLSERRAASVVEWLTTQGGIPRRRMEIRGFGETSPVVPNTNPDGTDNPDGRQKNRRVEIIVPRSR